MYRSLIRLKRSNILGSDTRSLGPGNDVTGKFLAEIDGECPHDDTNRRRIGLSTSFGTV